MTGRLHVGDVVAEPDHIDHLPGPLVVFGVEGIDVADAAAHEQEDDRLGSRGEVRGGATAFNFTGLCPERPHCDAEESAARLVEEFSPGDASAGIEASAHVNRYRT